MAATASGRCECRREAAVERATAGREAAGATATRAGACATAVKVQRARARAFLLMYYRRAQVAGVVCGVHARDMCVCLCVVHVPAWKPPDGRRRGLVQAAAWRDLMRVHITNIFLNFSGRQDSYSRDAHRVQHGNTMIIHAARDGKS